MKLKRYILYIVGMLLLFPVAKAAEPYVIGDNTEMDHLVSVLQPTIYAVDGELKRIKETEPATVVVANTKSYSLLTVNNSWFNDVKILIVAISDTEELDATLKLEDLKGFEKLQSVIVIYEFDVCGDQSSDCLKKMTDNIVKGHDDLSVFYQLSIAE